MNDPIVWLCDFCHFVVARGRDWSPISSRGTLRDAHGTYCPRCGLAVLEWTQTGPTLAQERELLKRNAEINEPDIGRFGFRTKKAPKALVLAATGRFARANAEAWKQYAFQRESRCLAVALEMCQATDLPDAKIEEVRRRVSRLLGRGRGKHGLARPLRHALGIRVDFASPGSLRGLKGRFAQLNAFDEALVAAVVASVAVPSAGRAESEVGNLLRARVGLEPKEWRAAVGKVEEWFRHAGKLELTQSRGRALQTLCFKNHAGRRI
jgi:hypothetical protein